MHWTPFLYFKKCERTIAFLLLVLIGFSQTKRLGMLRLNDFLLHEAAEHVIKDYDPYWLKEDRWLWTLLLIRFLFSLNDWELNDKNVTVGNPKKKKKEGNFVGFILSCRYPTLSILACSFFIFQFYYGLQALYRSALSIGQRDVFRVGGL